jgi:hypothetical protein
MKMIYKLGLTASVMVSSIVYFFTWRSPAHFKQENDCRDTVGILSMRQYRLVRDTHARPFIVQTERVLVYGSNHTKNPDDPQIKDIEEKWNSFKPTVLLVEGRLGFLMPGIMNPVKTFGENGKAYQLAKKNKVTTLSWEMEKDNLMKLLTEKFPAEQVALKEILNPYFSNLRFGKPDNPEKYVSQSLDRARFVGQENTFKTVDDVDRIWKRDFPNIDWRNESDHDMLPGYLQDIADATQRLRNIQLVCMIKELTAKGERVFVVAGSSHAVCIEKAVKP